MLPTPSGVVGAGAGSAVVAPAWAVAGSAGVAVLGAAALAEAPGCTSRGAAWAVPRLGWAPGAFVRRPAIQAAALTTASAIEATTLAIVVIGDTACGHPAPMGGAIRTMVVGIHIMATTTGAIRTTAGTMGTIRITAGAGELPGWSRERPSGRRPRTRITTTRTPRTRRRSRRRLADSVRPRSEPAL